MRGGGSKGLTPGITLYYAYWSVLYEGGLEGSHWVLPYIMHIGRPI